MKPIQRPAYAPYRHSDPGRQRPAARPIKRKTQFRRSDVARYASADLATQGATLLHTTQQPVRRDWQQLWSHWAIPSGIAVFWALFLNANWVAISQLLKLTSSGG